MIRAISSAAALASSSDLAPVIFCDTEAGAREKMGQKRRRAQVEANSGGSRPPGVLGRRDKSSPSFQIDEQPQWL